MAITAMAHVTKFDKKELERLREEFADYDDRMLKKSQYDEALSRIRVRKSDKEILDRMFILFDETGDAMVDWRCFLIGLCLLMKKESFDRKLIFAFALFDPENAGTVGKSDCESVMRSMNDTIGWFGDKNLDDEDFEKMIDEHFESHPSVDAEGKYAYRDNVNAFSKNLYLESIIKKPNDKTATYRDIKDTLTKTEE